MDELRTHLEGNIAVLLPPEQLNHVVLMVYGVLRRAVEDGADSLHLTSEHLVWSKGNMPLGELRINYTQPAVSFRDALTTIVARDPMVQRYVQLTAASPDTLAYAIVEHPLMQAA